MIQHLQRMKERKNLYLITSGEQNESDTRENSSTMGSMIQFGMFPQLQGLAEEDFASAEWHAVFNTIQNHETRPQ